LHSIDRDWLEKFYTFEVRGKQKLSVLTGAILATVKPGYNNSGTIVLATLRTDMGTTAAPT